MRELITNEVFVGLLTAIFGGVMTYMGVSRKSRSDAAGIYTSEIRGIIQELKAQNADKDREISRLEELAEKLKEQVEQSKKLLDAIEQKEKEMRKLLEEKDEYIGELTQALKKYENINEEEK